MRKKILYFITALVLIISFGAFATQSQAKVQNEVKADNTKEQVDLSGDIYERGDVTTYGWPWTAIPKTVKKEYTSAGAVPESIYYEEYIDGKWYNGTLQRTGNIEKLQYTWRATFTGKINY